MKLPLILPLFLFACTTQAQPPSQMYDSAFHASYTGSAAVQSAACPDGGVMLGGDCEATGCTAQGTETDAGWTCRATIPLGSRCDMTTVAHCAGGAE